MTVAGFWDAASTGFVRGVGLGVDSAENARRFALEKQRHDAEMKERGLRMQQAQRVNDATERLGTLQRAGVQNTDVIRAQDEDFDRAVELTGRGLDAAPADPKLWQAPLYRPATERDMNAGLMELAVARGDAEGVQLGLREQRRLGVAERFKAMSGPEREKYRQQSYAYINSTGTMPFTIGDHIDEKGKPTGFKTVHAVLEDGSAKTIRLSRADEDRLLLGIAHIEEGDAATGLAVISGVDKDLAARAAKALELDVDAARLHNDATSKNLEVQNDRERTRIARAGLGRERAPQWQQFEGADGQPVLVDMNAIPRGPDGTARLPQGLKWPRQKPETLTPREVAAYRFRLIEQGITDPIEQDMIIGSLTGGPGSPGGLAERLRAMDGAAAQHRQRASAAEAERIRLMRAEEQGRAAGGLPASASWYTP